MHNIAIFSNPIAGRGRGRTLAQRLFNCFTGQGWRSQLFFDHPAQVEPARLEDLTAAVSIGGDGTLRAVVERVTRGGSQPGPGVLLVPMGTANLMGRHLGLAWSPRTLERHAVHALQHRRTAMVDLAQCIQPDPAHPGGLRRQLVLLMVGVGLDGEIVHAIARARRGPIGFATYLMPTFRTLARYAFPRLEVEVDGRLVWPMAPAIAFASNIAEYGWGMPLLPDARSNDGLLDVMILPARSRSELVHHTMSAVLGEHVHDEGVAYVKGKEVRIRADRPVAVQADGDPAGFTPVELRLLPMQAAFIVPTTDTRLLP